MGEIGTAVVDFGASPGSQVASFVVTGQTGIVAGAGNSSAEAWIMGDTTAGPTGHNEDEHEVIALFSGVSCRDLVTGVGFTIRIISTLDITGLVSVRWAWF